MQGSSAGVPTMGRRRPARPLWTSFSISPSPRASPSHRSAGPDTAAARPSRRQASPATPRPPAQCRPAPP
eukprot:scaffold99748_cov56-Phaeocystis_antarctica.AAC.2